jgi:2'-hydroxyisoflavone reductase
MVGPRDTSGRFIYWPVRASFGGTMAVPGSPADPIQLIDVRDVADWTIHCIENQIVGIYNVTGPDKELSMRGMVEGVRKGVGSEVSFTWIDNRFLEAHSISQDKFPLYVLPTADSAGFHRRSIARALARGLRFRPLSVTAKATLDWYQSLPPSIQAGVAPQFAKRSNEEPWLDTEKHLLEAWAKHSQDTANQK